MINPAPGPVAVVSPHLDDGVFSCGDLLGARPGSIVITVFTGKPPAGDPPTDWDADAGFGPGDDVIAARQTEDEQALRVLGTRPCWLGFLEDQYGGTPPAHEIAAALARALDEVGAATVLVPLGLFHRDHDRVAEAALVAARRQPDRDWLLYEDAIYRRLAGLLQARLAALSAQGLRLTPVQPPQDARRGLKRRAVARYRSQRRAFRVRGLTGYADVFTPERYWQLERPG